VLRVDGVDRADTPVRIDDLAVGAHRVEVIAAGHAAFAAEVEIRADRAVLLEPELRPLPSP
jgi:hypothetical protein